MTLLSSVKPIYDLSSQFDSGLNIRPSRPRSLSNAEAIDFSPNVRADYYIPNFVILED